MNQSKAIYTPLLLLLPLIITRNVPHKLKTGSESSVRYFSGSNDYCCMYVCMYVIQC